MVMKSSISLVLYFLLVSVESPIPQPYGNYLWDLIDKSITVMNCGYFQWFKEAETSDKHSCWRSYGGAEVNKTSVLLATAWSDIAKCYIGMITKNLPVSEEIPPVFSGKATWACNFYLDIEPNKVNGDRVVVFFLAANSTDDIGNEKHAALQIGLQGQNDSIQITALLTLNGKKASLSIGCLMNFKDNEMIAKRHLSAAISKSNRTTIKVKISLSTANGGSEHSCNSPVTVPPGVANYFHSNDSSSINYSQAFGAVARSTDETIFSVHQITADFKSDIPFQIPLNLIVPISIASGILLVFMIIGAIVVVKRYRRRNLVASLDYSPMSETGSLATTLAQPTATLDPNLESVYINYIADSLPYVKKFEISEDLLDRLNIIGQGFSGIVFDGSLRRPDFFGEKPPKRVAIKEPKQKSDVHQINLLLCEFKLLAHVGSHPNIVGLIGVAATMDNFSLVLEFCEGGDLKKFLLKNRGKFATTDSPDRVEDNITNEPRMFNQALLVSFSQQISAGMGFLHSKLCIHRDLAARNVLLCNNDTTVKITDFGLAKDIYKDQIYEQSSSKLIPWAWYAPEFLKSKFYVLESDVWSFGVLLWEIFSLGEHPYYGLDYNPQFVSKLEKGLRLEKPCCADDVLYEMMIRCWSLDSAARPTFASLESELENWVFRHDNGIGC